MPSATYVHRLYEAEVVPAPQLARAQARLPDGWDYDVLKFDRTTGTLTFTHTPDWNEAPDPVVGLQVRVASHGEVHVTAAPRDPWLYHHKWQFVADDYTGFDPEASRAWSSEWTTLPQMADPCFRARIGRRSFWLEHVLPLIAARHEA